MSEQVTEEQVGHTLVIRLQGRLDARAVEEIKAEFQEVTNSHVLLNLADVSFIDSSGLGLVVSTFRRIRENEGDLSLCALSPQVRTIFELTRLHRVFDIYATEELALAAASA